MKIRDLRIEGAAGKEHLRRTGVRMRTAGAPALRSSKERRGNPMITSVNSTGGTANTTSTTGTTGTSGTTDTSRTTLGKDEFLTLLVTQLRNQDPMSPLQPQEFAAQLAQFSAVEQLTQVNDTLTAQGGDIRAATVLSKTAFSAALMGRTVTAQGDQVTIPDSGSASIHLDVGTGGGNATLKIVDDSGSVVATRDLGHIEGGKQTIDLPDDLPKGTYHYEVKIEDNAGKRVSVTTYTTGVVTGISFENGDIILRIGDMKVSLDSVAEVAGGTSNG
jgi:flagellar basal-body rod modification protein FlgD